MRAVAAALVALALAAGGCGGSGDGQDVRIRLVVEDENIRAEGTECAGARPFQYVHAEAGYSLEDRSGEVLAEGELPPGRSVNADPTIDWGVERIPTFCVFELEVEDVTRSPSYALRLERGSPLPFDASFVEGGESVRLTLR
jgi:hypothetical protein